MKKPSKKAQVYGLSTFLYALAIAIVLIVALIGMSKEFETKSNAGSYRFSTIIASRTAETTKKLMEQERSYVFDKSLFFTGAFGGYTPYRDLMETTNCTHVYSSGQIMSGCLDCNAAVNRTCMLDCKAAVSECITECSAKATGWTCHDGKDSELSKENIGMCYNGTDLEYGTFGCYASVKDITNPALSCSVRDNSLDYVGEKKVAYWREYNKVCMPDETKINSVIQEYAGQFFAKPNQELMNALAFTTGHFYDFSYLLKIKDFSNEQFELSWFPIGLSSTGDITGITLKFPTDNPVVEYTFSTFIHTYTKTPFYKLYTLSKENIVYNDTLDMFFNSSKGTVPFYVDEDFLVEKRFFNQETDQYETVNCTTSSDYCANPKPFKALVLYANQTYPHTSRDFFYYGDEKIECSTLALNSVSDTYTKSCTLHTKRQPGFNKLELSGFSGTCTDSNTIDDKAMKCTLILTMNNINSRLSTEPVIRTDSNIEYNVQFMAVNITYTGKTDTTHLLYNATI